MNELSRIVYASGLVKPDKDIYEEGFIKIIEQVIEERTSLKLRADELYGYEKEVRICLIFYSNRFLKHLTSTKKLKMYSFKYSSTFVSRGFSYLQLKLYAKEDERYRHGLEKFLTSMEKRLIRNGRLCESLDDEIRSIHDLDLTGSLSWIKV